jgi:hypothetical protein
MPQPKQTDFSEQLIKVFVPEEYLTNFEPQHISNKPDCWMIELIEKEDKIPEALKDKEVVSDGYLNPVDILTHAFSLKKIYLRFYRRRWKEKGTTQGYFNHYELYKDMKTTREFRDFLKEIGG